MKYSLDFFQPYKKYKNKTKQQEKNNTKTNPLSSQAVPKQACRQQFAQCLIKFWRRWQTCFTDGEAGSEHHGCVLFKSKESWIWELSGIVFGSSNRPLPILQIQRKTPDLGLEYTLEVAQGAPGIPGSGCLVFSTVCAFQIQ